MTKIRSSAIRILPIALLLIASSANVTEAATRPPHEADAIAPTASTMQSAFADFFIPSTPYANFDVTIVKQAAENGAANSMAGTPLPVRPIGGTVANTADRPIKPKGFVAKVLRLPATPQRISEMIAITADRRRS